MAINYTWSVISLEKQNHENVQDAVCNVHWVRTGTDDTDNVAYGMMGATRFNMSDVDPNNFTPFANLTEQQVVTWIEALEHGNLDYYNSVTLDGINKRRNVTRVDRENLPWNPPTE